MDPAACDKYHTLYVGKITVIGLDLAHDINVSERGITTMIHMSVIEARISKIGCHISTWFKPEIRELQHILTDSEEIIGLAQGRYYGGFALLVATNHRILLIDKKIPFLSVEDIRYDMISEIDYSARLFDSTVTIFTVNKQHKFSSYKHKTHLRALTSYAQQRVMDFRQYPQQVSVPPANGSSFSHFLAPATMAPEQVVPPPEPPQPLPAIKAVKASAVRRVHRLVGGLAIHGAQWHFVNLNPYTKSSFRSTHQWSFGGVPKR